MLSRVSQRIFVCLVVFFLVATGLSAFAQNSPVFTPGNLVVAVEGCGVHGGTCANVPNGSGTGTGNSSTGGYGDNQAAPLTLFQYTPNGTTSATFVNSLVLPQTGSGANLPIASEYGSSSEGTLQLSGAGQYLTIMEYGINAAIFDASPATYGAAPSNALAQSGSLTGQSYTPVPRVVTLIDANGNVNSSSAVFNVFNTNNPRSIYTLDGSTAYISGQGSGSDATSGVFFVPLGATVNTPTPITGLDTTGKTISQDTRDVQIVNNTLFVSVDTKGGSNSARDFIGTLGTPPATSLFNSGAGPTQLPGYGTKASGPLTISAGANSNGNPFNAGLQINLSPVNFFFASPSVLYVADGGNPKNNSANSGVGDGGLQKWINSAADGSGTWSLAYTLYQGLNLVQNNSGSGTSGLYGLTGTLVPNTNTVQLYATNFTLSDLDPTFLYGVSDDITFTTATQAAGEAFSVLDAAPSDSNFKGVSFAPTIPAGDVEVTTSPSGLAFTSAGTGCESASYTSPQTLTWTPGSSCTLSVTSPIPAGTGVQYAFSQWQDGTTATTDAVTAPATTATYTATFTTQYQLTTTSGNGGTVSAGGFFNAGTDATITATPAPGFTFINFTGTSTSTNNPFTLTMNAPQTITANFAQLANQTITCSALPAVATFGSSFTASCAASSNLPVTYTSAGACSNSGTTYTMTSSTGSCSVIANQPGNNQFAAAPQVTLSVAATTATQTITVTTPAPATATLKSSFTIVAASTSGAPVVFGSSGGCTNVGATYTMASTGNKVCVEILNVPADANNTAAPQVVESTSVAKAITPTVSFTGAPAAATFGSSFTVSATSNSSSVPTFATVGPCTIDSATSTVSITSGVGVCSITAVWAANDVYARATAIQKITAQKAASVITWANPAPITYGTPLSATQLNATANTAGTFIYTPAASRVLTAGVQSLSLRFVPSSQANFTTVVDDVVLTVNSVDTTVAITSSTPNPSLAGKIVTFSFDVMPAITSTVKPTGSVTVTASSGESCTGKLAGGKSICKITFATSGARTVTASYAGDANDNASISAEVTQTVNP